MATQSNLVFTDAQSSPANHTLEPNGIQRDSSGTEVALYRENDSARPLEGQIVAKFARKKLPSGVHQVSMDLSIPVLENVTGGTTAGYTAPPKVAYVDRIVVTQYIHPRSTMVGRKSVRRFASTMVSGANIAGEPLYYDTAPADLFDKVIFPS